MNKSKGFTIIELLIVVAIIAVLTGIVLVNVVAYINSGKNAAIQGNLSTLLTNSATYFDANPTVFGEDFVNDSKGCLSGDAIFGAIAIAGGGLACNGDTITQAWCGYSNTLSSGLSGPSTFCVDSTGYKGVQGSSGCSATVFTCQ